MCGESFCRLTNCLTERTRPSKDEPWLNQAEQAATLSQSGLTTSNLDQEDMARMRTPRYAVQVFGPAIADEWSANLATSNKPTEMDLNPE
jgi:hypothetical protein